MLRSYRWDSQQFRGSPSPVSQDAACLPKKLPLRPPRTVLTPRLSLEERSKVCFLNEASYVVSAVLSGFLNLCVPFSQECLALYPAALAHMYIHLSAVVSARLWTIYEHNEREWFETFLVGFLKISTLLTLALTHDSRIRLTVSGFEGSLRGTTLLCTFRKKSPVGMPAVLCYFKWFIFFFNIILSHSEEWL